MIWFELVEDCGIDQRKKKSIGTKVKNKTLTLHILSHEFSITNQWQQRY